MFRFIYVIIANLFRGPVFIPKMRKMAANPEKYSDEARYAYCKYAIHFMMKSGHISTDVYGLENLPKDTGYVMFPNHQGKYDALGIIYAHEEPCSFVMDEAKSNGFLVKEIVNLVDAKRLKINDVRHGLKIMNEITEDVKVGKKYILFSEGGYHKNRNHVQEFKPGSFKSAVRAQVPIVPVCLIDSYKPFNSLELGKITTKVIFLPPLYYEDYKDMKTPQIASIVRSQIIDKMAEFGIDATSE